MLECLEFKKVEPFTLDYLRNMQLKDMKGQVQDFIEEGIVTYKADFFKIIVEEDIAGYAVIGTRGYYKEIVLEYYLLYNYRSYSAEIFNQLVKSFTCKGWFVNTHDSFALPVIPELGLAFEIEGYIFSIDDSKNPDHDFGLDTTFEISRTDELKEIYELIIQDGFYTGGGIETVEVIIAKKELYSLRLNGKLIGTGFVSKLNRTPQYAEIAMIINSDERQKGLGTLIVKALINESRRRNLIPAASCYVNNKVSRKTLEKAGFYLEGCILKAQI